MIERRPRAPVLRSMALRAMAPKAVFGHRRIAAFDCW
jgi:hypothetical protein